MLEWGQLFSGEILWRGSNFPVVFLREQFACLIILGCNYPRGQLSVGQFSSEAIIFGENCPVGNYLGDNHPGGNNPGDNFPRG